MAFVFNNFATVDSAGLGTQSAFSFHKYTTNDTVATAAASGYFNSITKMLSKGDLIIVSAGVSGTPASNVLIVSSTTAAATVTTASISTATQTYNNLAYISFGIGAMNAGETQYHPVPASGSVLRFYGTADSNGGGATATYTLLQNGGSNICTNMAFTSGYVAGTLITGTVASVPLVVGTDVLKITSSVASVTGAGKVHLLAVFSPS